ncbi:MAG: DUF4383 domain-containing protein [bacterium]
MTKKVTMILGVVVLLVGLLGFVNNPVLGIFAVDAIHNLIHIIVGIVLIMGAKGANTAKTLKTVGIVVILVALLGFFVSNDEGKILGLIMSNSAANWLHLILGVVFVGLSMKDSNKMATTTPSQPSNPMQGGMGGGQM